MKLRYLASILGALCSLLHAHAQPLPARQTTLPGTYRISAGTQLSYETPLAPLAGYLREYINVGKASDSMSADDAIVAFDRSDAGRRSLPPDGAPAAEFEIAGGSYGGVIQRRAGPVFRPAARRNIRQELSPASGRNRLHEGRGRARAFRTAV